MSNGVAGVANGGASATKPLAIGSLSRSIAITGMLVLAPFAA
jgi:hypothetical protein